MMERSSAAGQGRWSGVGGAGLLWSGPFHACGQLVVPLQGKGVKGSR